MHIGSAYQIYVSNMRIGHACRICISDAYQICMLGCAYRMRTSGTHIGYTFRICKANMYIGNGCCICLPYLSIRYACPIGGRRERRGRVEERECGRRSGKEGGVLGGWGREPQDTRDDMVGKRGVYDLPQS